ncbi:MAG: tetratricopeptide repeat protein [Planctomycetes bacterium]|nr:tetratricopeptide repeat protein [Planctomycetota bacterium]
MRAHRPTVAVSVGLVALTLFAFGDLVWGGPYEFVNFDDPEYVVNNPKVHAPLSIKGVRRALASSDEYNWIPLTWLSLQLDYQFHGLNPRGYHVTNVALHAANAVLLFLFLYRATGRRWPAAVVAALFAVHPLRVESVAWVTERKDVLCGFFWLLALHAYLWYAARPGRGRYLAVAAAFGLALMSKPMAVTLPCVLLLLDYWPLRRWSGAPDDPDADPRPPARTARQLLLEKVPLFLMVAGAAHLQTRAAAPLVAESRQLIARETRWLNAPVSYFVYLRQLVWPADLAALYLHPPAGVARATAGLAAAALLAVTLAVVYVRRARPYLLVGWLWFLGTLVPVLGLIPVARQAHADRFTYLPLIGVFVAVCWTAGRARVGLAFAGVAVAACVLATQAQVRHWRSSSALWDRAVAVSGGDPRLHGLASAAFFKEQRLDEALRHADAMRAAAPDDPGAEQARAVVLLALGRPEEALGAMERQAALGKDSPELRNAMARLLWRLGRIPESYRATALVAEREPECPPAQHYFGLQRQREGKLDEAVRHLARAAELDRDNARYHADLALALADAGNDIAAAERYQVAVRLQPNWAEVSAGLGWLLATHPDPARRDGPEAVRWGRIACALTENKYPPCLEVLAAAHAEAGQFERAAEVAAAARDMARAAGDRAFAEQMDGAIRSFHKRQPIRAP